MGVQTRARRRGAPRGRRTGVSTSGPAGPRPAYLDRRDVVAELDGWAAGQAVRLASDPDPLYRLLEFKVPHDPGVPPHAELWGGDKGYEKFRSRPLSDLRTEGWAPEPTEAQLAAWEAARGRPAARTAPAGDPALGAALRAAREAAGMSRRQLEEETGVRASRVLEVEAGRRGLDAAERGALEDALGELEGGAA